MVLAISSPRNNSSLGQINDLSPQRKVETGKKAEVPSRHFLSRHLFLIAKPGNREGGRTSWFLQTASCTCSPTQEETGGDMGGWTLYEAPPRFPGLQSLSPWTCQDHTGWATVGLGTNQHSPAPKRRMEGRGFLMPSLHKPLNDTRKAKVVFPAI